jgi:P27 family predicted phage terminase small subunit
VQLTQEKQCDLFTIEVTKMGKRGPKPTPNKTLEMRGSPWAKYAPNRKGVDAPDPVVETSPCPDWVTGLAREHWDEISQMLKDQDVLTRMDNIALALLVDALAQYIQAKQEHEGGSVTITTAQGNVIQDPCVGVINKAWERVLKALREFGMTPSSRTAVSVSKIAGKKGQIVNAKQEWLDRMEQRKHKSDGTS